jgi:hypothetical protein
MRFVIRGNLPSSGYGSFFALAGTEPGFDARDQIESMKSDAIDLRPLKRCP